MTFTACEKDPADLYALNATAPVMDSHADILLTESSTQESVTFSWKEARNMGGEVMYTLYATNEGQEISLTTTSGTYFTTGKDAFRELLLTGFNLEANNNFSIGMYVEASNGAATLSSEAITMNVFVYGDYVPAIVSVVETAQEGVVLTEAMTENVELISWTAARFEYGTNPLYKVEVVYGEGRQTLAEGMPTTSFGMNPTTLNSTLIALGCVKEAANDVQFIVTSYLEGEGAPQLESTAVTVTVTPFTPSYPEFIKLCGDFGGHSWKPESNLPILKGDANTGVYHGLMSYYGGTYGMKIIYTHPKTQETIWVGAKTEDGVNFAVGVEDNIAPEEGSYVVYVDLAKGVMTLGKIESIGLIGSATANGWDGQTNFTYNAETGAMELKGVSLGEGAYKVRVNDNWGNPWEDPTAYNLGGDPADMTFGGSDIPSEPGVYDVTMNLSTDANYALTFTKTGDVVIDDPMTKNYGLCGTITDWAEGADLAFEKVEGEDYVIVKNVKVTAEDAFKVRVDNSWNENYGGPGETKPYVLAVDTKVELVAGGQDMAMAAGSYDFYFYPKTKEIIAVVAGGELPTPTAAYAVIGEFNKWDLATQVPMEEANNGYVVAKNLNLTGVDIPGNGFKVKENVANWNNSWGSGSMLELGVPTAVYHNGGNMGLAAEGAYDVYFNAEKLLIIVVAAGADDPTGAEPVEPTETVYSVAGTFNSWGETDMADNGDGFFVLKNQTVAAGNAFKFKKNHSWADADCWGVDAGVTTTVGAAITLVQPGADIPVPAEGTYDIYFNPTTGVAYIMNVGETPGGTTPAPTNVYSLAGDMNGWAAGDTTYTLTSTEAGVYTVENVALNANQGFKICKDYDWKTSYGLSSGVTFAFSQKLGVTSDNGANIVVPGKGTFNITFYETDAQVLVEPVGEVEYPSEEHTYSLAGTFNSWSDTDTTYTLIEGEEGVYTYQNLALTAAGEFKIVRDYAWTVSYGLSSGASAVVGQKMAVTTTGANIAIAAGTYNITFYAASSELLIEAVGSSEPSTPTVLQWGNDVWKAMQEKYGTDETTESPIDCGNGLVFSQGSGKGVKFGGSDPNCRVQLSGSGNATEKCVFLLTVSGPGTIAVDMQASGYKEGETRKMGIAINGTDTASDGYFADPDARTVYTVDCSSATANSVIAIYSMKSGINIFDIKWTPAQ